MLAQLAIDRTSFVEGQRRIQSSRRDAATGKKIDLILHEGDQRRDNERQTLEHQGRQLIAETLAGAGRKNGQD